MHCPLWDGHSLIGQQWVFLLGSEISWQAYTLYAQFPPFFKNYFESSGDFKRWILLQRHCKLDLITTTVAYTSLHNAGSVNNQRWISEWGWVPTVPCETMATNRFQSMDSTAFSCVSKSEPPRDNSNPWTNTCTNKIREPQDKMA